MNTRGTRQGLLHRFALVAVTSVCVLTLSACSSLEGLNGARSSDGGSGLLFVDDFSRLDDAVWTRCYPWAATGSGCTNNVAVEREWYQKGNVTLSNGKLELAARHEPALNPDYEYTSGFVSTGGVKGQKAPSFAFTYGYAEISAKLPAGRSTWPAFWFLPTTYGFPPELDVLEGQGVNPRWYLTNVFYSTGKKSAASLPGEHPVTADLSADYHQYGVDWQPDYIRWYFDGNLMFEVDDPAAIPRVPMYLALNLAVGGWLPGQLPPDPAVYPATFYVDWVRVWDRRPAESGPNP